MKSPGPQSYRLLILAGALLSLTAAQAVVPEPAAAVSPSTTTSVAPTPAAASPEDPLIAHLTLGRVQWLEAAGTRFWGLYTEALADDPQGGIILLHGLGAHPDWPEVIVPLRRDLPHFGWAVLSIQLPAATQNPDRQWELTPVFEAAAARIAAAASFLEQQGLKNIVVIGHDSGAAAAITTLAGAKNDKIAALVAIGLGLPPYTAATPYQPALLEKIAVPMLDIYGSQDLDAVKQEADARALAARKGRVTRSASPQADSPQDTVRARAPVVSKNADPLYQQMEFPGADHFFTGNETALIKRIAGWLKKHAAGRTIDAASK